jgi:hypothetical protein
MGYAWNSTCYQDAASALEAFKRDSVRSDGTAITTFTASPSISLDGLVSWSISHRPLTDSIATVRTGTTQLPACTTEDFSQWPQQDMFVYLAIFFSFFLGFRTGFRP